MHAARPSDPRARAREIFLDALELSDAPSRARFLADACGKDPALRDQVELLLSEHFVDEAFMAVPAAGEMTGVEFPDEAGGTIGRYQLIERLGEGGMGVVYRAEQREPVRRQVALKIIKLGMDTRQVVARFEAERQALALMDHPSIAKVLDGGMTGEGNPEVRSPKSEGTPKSEAPAGSPRLLAEREAGREADSPLPSDGRGVGGEGVSPSASPIRPLAVSPSRRLALRRVARTS